MQYCQSEAVTKYNFIYFLFIKITITVIFIIPALITGPSYFSASIVLGIGLSILVCSIISITLLSYCHELMTQYLSGSTV